MILDYDKELEIATASSRKTKTWRNRKVKWSELADRLSKTTRTPETVAEYKAMKRDRQSDIKDVGGFVGGYLNNGRRTDVRFRSVICLDADFAKAELWDDWCALFGAAAVVYSTHKHTPQQPRIRLVVPLSRNVTPDEYQAIGRRIADSLAENSIDWFDDTSYQPERVMYWPSTSQDGEFYFRLNDQEFLDPDVILSTYHDWRDMSSWPVSSRVTDLQRRAAQKQQDPLSKPGLVGAFCRAYGIRDAVETFVPDYVPCDEPGRYTYAKGSTAAGVVVYEDKYTYSYHATDPASLQLCNAWDLVRLHQFAELDENVDPETPVSSRPSYKAMSQLATDDPNVRAQLVSDRMAEAAEDFSTPVVDGDDWKQQLKITEKGGIAQTIGNVVVILEHDPNLAGRLAYNEMSQNIVLVQSTPWREVNGESQWTDTDDASLRYYLENVYGLGGKDKIFDAVNVVAQEHTFHPVRDYLDSCDWDGTPRVEELLIRYLGADDTPYVRAVTRKAITGAVARIYKPGIKFDYMLVLRGEQGKGKTTLVKRLGGDWYSDSFSTVQGKDAYEQILGVWIMEVGELAGMKKAEAESIKLYISKQVDRFRPAYGRRTREFPRQCIFIGTTNETQFLRDATGNRRFWVVDLPNTSPANVWDELDDALVRQIWGEAVQIWHKGEKLYLSHELEEEARRIQEIYEEEDPRRGVIETYLEHLLPEDWEDMDLYSRREWLQNSDTGTVKREIVTAYEIAVEALGYSPERLERRVTYEIRSIMQQIKGWRHQGSKMVTTKLYGRQKYYRRIGP